MTCFLQNLFSGHPGSWLSLCLMFVLLGCSPSGGELSTVPVSGQVTFNGAPLPDGQILFRTTDTQQRGFAAKITDGKFSLETVPGKMSVEITASRLVPGKFNNDNGTPEPAGEMYIPAEYNSSSTLKAEVVAGGQNSFDYQLTGPAAQK
jgi:hypothetical protein